MLKFTRNSVIAFDFHEALSFEGETGPYAQYAAVRASNILRKYEERGGKLPEFEEVLSADDLAACLAADDIWQLRCSLRRPETRSSERSLPASPPTSPNTPFNWRRALITSITSTPLSRESDEARRNVLLWLTQYVRNQLLATLQVLGIEQPSYM